MRRLVEIIVGAALIGSCVHAMYVGQVGGSWRVCRRSEAPWMFWFIVVISAGIGAAFLFGAVSWRE